MKVGKVTKTKNTHSCKEVLLLTSRETALKNRKGISQVKQPCLPTHTSLASAMRLSGVSSHHRPLSAVALLRVHQHQVTLTQLETPRQGGASGASLYVAFYLGKISVGGIAYRVLSMACFFACLTDFHGPIGIGRSHRHEQDLDMSSPTGKRSDLLIC